MYTAQNALNSTLLSATARTTGSDVFPSPSPSPSPTPTPTSYSKGLVIGLGCAGGALLIGLIIVVVCLIKQKKKTAEMEVVYNTVQRESDQPLI